MKTTFKDEAEFEATLVEELRDRKGWSDGILRYPTEQDLLDNWARILFENNMEPTRLNGQPLTATEMQQILNQINTLQTPEKINRFINGGVVSVQRDNPLDTLNYGHVVYLHIYSRDAIAGGPSRYQIAVQPKFKAREDIFPDRRGDVMLLINGMPVIHIELKCDGIDVTQAVYQIEKYSREGVFATGIFSLVQFFVAMTPTETLYFANPGVGGLTAEGHFNRKYMFHWADTNNVSQNDWHDVVEGLLSIPKAHMMIGFYTVPDAGDGNLKIMRSYQYYAVSAICEKVRLTDWDAKRPLGGYIWHTTGSGKTLTSFKAAQLIAARHLADKVVFLVDRVELAEQSIEEYRNFSNDDETVRETEDTAQLFSYMTSGNRSETLIVTSIQKMSNADGEKRFVTPEQVEIINSKRVVLIVDECHRDTFGLMMLAIKETFPHALLFGFTGTPIGIENKKKGCTTSDVFGDELHRYTIGDGMRDGNVLGFDPIKVCVYEDSGLREKIGLQQAKANSVSEALADSEKREVFLRFMNDVPMADGEDSAGKYVKGIESYLQKSQWQTKEYREAIVDDIVKKWEITSIGGTFHALFATSSIHEAIVYYGLFKDKAPDLKVTALFDPNIDNSDGYAFKTDGLVEILKDYETRYGKSFTLSNHAGFKSDVSLRLAHKDQYKHIERKPEEQIDILIVVDQMLTGFDSEWLNTLYLDKMLECEHVIQAFSRTNRLSLPEKRFGVIRYYRKPHTMEKNIEEAVGIYSGDNPLVLFVSKLGENLQDINAIYTQIQNLFHLCGIDNFEHTPATEGDCTQFAKLFKDLSAKIESARVQGFTWKRQTYGNADGLDEEVEVLLDEDTYLVLAQRYKELFDSNGTGGSISSIPFEIDTHLTSIDTGHIDAKYMEANFKRWLVSLSQPNVSDEETQELLDAVHSQFNRLSRIDQVLAEVLIHDIQTGDIELEPGMGFHDYLNRYRQYTEAGRIDAIAEAFGVDRDMLVELMRSTGGTSDPNSYGRLDALSETIDAKKAKIYFCESLGYDWKPRIVRQRADMLVKHFVVKGDFDLKDEVERRWGKA